MPLRASSLVRFNKWQRRIDVRGVVRRSRSFHGVAIAGLFLVASPSVYQLMRDGPFEVTDASSAQILGALVIAHVAFGLTFAAIARLSIATGLVLRFQHAPLRAHPSLLPVALLHEVAAVGIRRNALLTLFFLYGLYWRLFSAIIANPFQWGVHLALMAMAFVAIGAIAFHRVRQRVLRADAPRDRAMLANKRGVFAALLCTLGGFGGTMFLADRTPWVLERIGEASSAMSVFFIPPLHAVTASSPLPGVFWLLVGGLTTALLWRRALRSAPRWSIDLPVDHQHASSLAPARLRSLIVGRGRVRRASAFAAKDLLLPVVRAPARHALQQWFSFAAVAGILILVRFGVADAREMAAPLLFPVLVAFYALIQAALATLHLLGTEGRRIALLMPTHSARALLVLKGAPALLFVTAHTVAGTVPLVLLGKVLGFSGIPVVGSLGVAVLAGLAAAALGVTTGFFLPDFERRSVAAPGATLAGRFTFFALGGFVLAVFGVLRTLAHSEALPRIATDASIGILVVLVLAFAATMGLRGAHRLSRLEI